MAKENALAASRNTQTAGIFRSINKSGFERLPGHREKLRHALDVAFGEINEPLLLAAFRTPRLALEAHVYFLDK
jgi:hypothetical protein